mmetsp:Transcript_2874/g.3205  ORF Transcript_2874/g.3205 Transcript_2874/m.3205 type:complete len:197 (+) Transcript_2874:98-688(+)
MASLNPRDDEYTGINISTDTILYKRQRRRKIGYWIAFAFTTTALVFSFFAMIAPSWQVEIKGSRHFGLLWGSSNSTSFALPTEKRSAGVVGFILFLIAFIWGIIAAVYYILKAVNRKSINLKFKVALLPWMQKMLLGAITTSTVFSLGGMIAWAGLVGFNGYRFGYCFYFELLAILLSVGAAVMILLRKRKTISYV